MYERLPHMYPKRGAASIGGQSPADAWFHSFLSWPPSLLSSTLSSALHAFGHKSSTLEAIALCLPLLTIPNLCRNRHICFYTDNKAWSAGGRLDIYCMILKPLFGFHAFLFLKLSWTVIFTFSILHEILLQSQL